MPRNHPPVAKDDVLNLSRKGKIRKSRNRSFVQTPLGECLVIRKYIKPDIPEGADYINKAPIITSAQSI